MLKYFNVFYKQYGIRRLSHFLVPRLVRLDTLSRDSTLHYLGDGSTPNIDPSLPYLSEYRKRILVRYIEQLKVEKGNPRKKVVALRPLTAEFHRNNKRFKFDINHNPSTDPTTLEIYNYSYLDVIYRYPPTPVSEYNKWYNTYETILSSINELATGSQRNHFFELPLDGTIPSRGVLTQNLNRNDIQRARSLSDNLSKVVFEFWKWIDPDTRKDSIFSLIDEDNLHKVNFIFKNRSGMSVVLNLSYLNGFINHEDIESDASMKLQPRSLRNVLLKFFYGLTDVIESETVNEAEDSDQEKTIHASEPNTKESSNLDEEDLLDSSTEVIKELTTIDVPMDIDDDDIVYEDTIDDVDGEKDSPITDSVLDMLENELTEIENIAPKINKVSAKPSPVSLTPEQAPEPIPEDLELNLPPTPELELDIDPEEVLQEIFKPKTVKESIVGALEQSAEEGSLTASEYRKLMKEIESFEVSKDPFGSGLNRTEASVVTEKDLQIDKDSIKIEAPDTVLDPSMTESTLLAFDRDYITKVAKKDTLRIINSIQKSKTIIRKHEVEESHNLLGSAQHHTLELRPIDGVPSTIHIKTPIIEPDGTFTAGGIKYSIRKQRVDLPIRKINPYAVALTSYYGKTFVRTAQRVAYNPLEYIYRRVEASIFEENNHITAISPANVFNNLFEAPYIYNAMAVKFKTITAGELELNFDERERVSLVGADRLVELETDGARVVGLTKHKEPIIVDKDDNFHIYRKGVKVSIGNIFNVLDLEEVKSPVAFTEVSIFNKTIPTGVVLAYYLGLDKLIAALKASYRVVPARRNRNLADDEYAIVFKDMSYIFTRKDRLASLVLGGFTEYKNITRTFKKDDFNSKDVYLNVLRARNIGVIYLRELDLIEEMFIDPFTEEILTSMKEPTTFMGLLIRASEMLQTYHHPDPQDMRYMRIRGYERVSGIIYSEMVRSIRSFRHRNISGRSKIEMSPYAVWQRIMKDPANKIVEDTNPIQNLKEQEIVTYVGEGGRSKDAIIKKTREYHKTDIGIISEATVDSSDVGVNTYLSSNPKFTNLRGMVEVGGEVSTTSLMSTSANLVVGADRDDPKRRNFISIQNGHVIACEGLHQPQVRTGYENIIPHRVSSMFCATAKKDGVVKSITEHGIIVQYKDGTEEGVELGLIHGSAEGTTYPHRIVTHRVEGQKLKKGDVIAYNSGFFEMDVLNPKEIIFKYTRTVNTALMESLQTFEDSCAISNRVSTAMTSEIIQKRSFTLEFGQAISEMVKVGQKVEPNDVLFIIQDAISSGVGNFDEESLKILRTRSQKAPRAQYLGTIERIDVIYNGDKRDMHPSLKTLADRSDKRLAEIAKSTGRPIVTGQVTEDYRVDGTPLTMDKVNIIIHILTKENSGVGDKLIFGAQGKSTVGEVMEHDVTTEDGELVDAIFGYGSFLSRIVLSAFVMGTTTSLLDTIADQAVQLYKGN